MRPKVFGPATGRRARRLRRRRRRREPRRPPQPSTRLRLRLRVGRWAKDRCIRRRVLAREALRLAAGARVVSAWRQRIRLLRRGRLFRRSSPPAGKVEAVHARPAAVGEGGAAAAPYMRADVARDLLPVAHELVHGEQRDPDDGGDDDDVDGDEHAADVVVVLAAEGVVARRLRKPVEEEQEDGGLRPGGEHVVRVVHEGLRHEVDDGVCVRGEAACEELAHAAALEEDGEDGEAQAPHALADLEEPEPRLVGLEKEARVPQLLHDDLRLLPKVERRVIGSPCRLPEAPIVLHAAAAGEHPPCAVAQLRPVEARLDDGPGDGPQVSPLQEGEGALEVREVAVGEQLVHGVLRALVLETERVHLLGELAQHLLHLC
mmetsp:Transcript_34961/g.109894  ORF Transcript_34961/g.109894 Transcript_34961/m.109894 type:complete len:375 (-) Transcript_34961:6815-7939(-)